MNADRVRELLEYEPGTGAFRWRATRGRAAKGAIAGYINNIGYRMIGIDGWPYSAHRLAWLYVHGHWPEKHLDHINGNPADNRLSNLRECSHAENMQNMKTRSDNRLGLTGVSRHNGNKKFAAEIRRDGCRWHLGYFDTAEEARAAYLAAKEKIHSFQPRPRAHR